MISTVVYYKKLLPPSKVQFDRIKTIIPDKWKENYDQLSKQIIKRTENLNNILALRQNNKFNRHKLDYEVAVTISSNTLKNLQNNKNLKEDLRSRILAGQNIPSYDPLNLYKGNTSLETGLTSLSRKGPSFVAVPPSYNWLQLQVDFYSFRNRLRARYLFRDKNSNYTPHVEGLPTKKPLTWRSPITNCTELETFLTLIEKDLFQNTKVDMAKDNVTRTERRALTNWRRDNLVNKETDTIMRLQDKGNRFVTVDKSTDRLKAQQQMDVVV